MMQNIIGGLRPTGEETDFDGTARSEQTAPNATAMRPSPPPGLLQMGSPVTPQGSFSSKFSPPLPVQYNPQVQISHTLPGHLQPQPPPRSPAQNAGGGDGESGLLRELVERYRGEMERLRSELNILRHENSALAEEIHSVMLQNTTLRMAALEQKPSAAGGGAGGGGGEGGLDEDESRKRLEAAEKEGKAQENIAQMLRKALAASQMELQDERAKAQKLAQELEAHNKAASVDVSSSQGERVPLSRGLAEGGGIAGKRGKKVAANDHDNKVLDDMRKELDEVRKTAREQLAQANDQIERMSSMHRMKAQSNETIISDQRARLAQSEVALSTANSKLKAAEEQHHFVNSKNVELERENQRLVSEVGRLEEASRRAAAQATAVSGTPKSSSSSSPRVLQQFHSPPGGASGISAHAVRRGDAVFHPEVSAGWRSRALLGEAFALWGEQARFMRMSGLRERFSSLNWFVGGKGGVVAELGNVPVGRLTKQDVSITGSALGAGVFATVVAGEWKIPCAIKKMKPAVNKGKQGERAHLDHFVREGEILRAVKHKHIVKLLGVVADSDMLAFVMERVAGDNLGDIIYKQKRTLPVEGQIGVAAQIAEGLAYLHSINIVHRDVKPDNIILDQKSMQAKLVDFGLSRALPSWKPHVIAEPGGTPAYWPPEVLATGATQRVHVCRKADQFGFAVTFLELFTLKLPWTNVTLEQLVSNVIHDQRPNIPENMPSGYAAIIRACWAGETKARPEFTEVIDLLAGVMGEIHM